MNAWLIRLEAWLSALNRCLIVAGSIGLMVAALILSYSVVARGLWGAATEWQDEASLFFLVGAIFLCVAYVQEKRGHVGIQAFELWLGAGPRRVLHRCTDLVSLLFFSFFTSKCWDLLHDAWVDGQVTNSTWAPPLWIPYALMFAGMLLLSLQLLVQVLRGRSESTPIQRTH
jgi:TRAP-type C4-dicarboxylate transport system permease small subunit